jgi:hypothetical protein
MRLLFSHARAAVKTPMAGVALSQSECGFPQGEMLGSRIKSSENVAQAKKTVVPCGHRAFFARQFKEEFKWQQV